MFSAIALKHVLEITEVFWRTAFQEFAGVVQCFFLLVFIIEAGGNRMVGVVNLLDEICHRQLQAMRPKPPGFRFWRQVEAWAQKLKDVGGVADDDTAGLENRWCKRGGLCRAVEDS